MDKTRGGNPFKTRAFFLRCVRGLAIVTLPLAFLDASAAGGEAPIRLRAGDTAPGESMPAAPIEMPAVGRLFLVQADSSWNEAARAFVRRSGCDLLGYVPEDTWLVGCASRDSIETIRGAKFVTRVEPYHCSYRLAPEIAAWLADRAVAEDEERRLRAVSFGALGKNRLAASARTLGADLPPDVGGGSILETSLTKAQARQLACDDNLAYLDVTHPPVTLMDNVRIDSGAVWLMQPENGGRCGDGVRGEVLDEGVDHDHREYADRLTLHGTVPQLSWHGTATFGILFSAGSFDAKSRGMLPCGTGVAGSFYTMGNRFSFTRQTKEVHHASFQSNSWGAGSIGGNYDSYAYDLDEIGWRLDFAVIQAAANSGDLPWPNLVTEALAKNAFTVGGFNHFDTATLADDFFCGHECAIHNTQAECTADIFCVWTTGACVPDEFYICASYGPTQDGRQKPDLSYWVDHIYTTDLDDGYRAVMHGTSSATPMTAGALGLILEMWADTSQAGMNPWGRSPTGGSVFEKQPHTSTMKALLVNSAEQYVFSGADHEFSRARQGWGRANARVAKDRAAGAVVVDEETVLTEGLSASWTIVVPSGRPDIRATLSWLDPPKLLAASGKQLLDDLDLKLISPADGTGNVSVYCGNAGLESAMTSPALWTGPGPASATPDCDDPLINASRNAVDNVENVIVGEPAPGTGVPAGIWTIEVKAFDVNVDQHTSDNCRGIDLDPTFPNAGRNACLAAGCIWNSTYGVCGDSTLDAAFGLVVTAGAPDIPSTPGESQGLTIARSVSGNLDLSWSADCGAGSTYGVYRGDLLAGYGSIAPEPGCCAVVGTSVTIPAGAGSADFFLVVPQTATSEGSYGVDSSGERRPAAAGACLPQGAIDACAP